MGNRTLYFVLSADNGKSVFVTKDGDMRIPEFPEMVDHHIGLENPHVYNRWFEQAYGIPVFRRYIIELEDMDSTIFLLELEDPSIGLQTGEFVSSVRVAALYDANPFLQNVLMNLSEDYSKSELMPWGGTDGYTPYLEWMSAEMRHRNMTVNGEIQQIKNAFVSTVFRCPTNQGDFYMKIPGSAYIREIAMTNRVREWGIAKLPEWVAADVPLNVFLMSDMGGYDLPADSAFDLLGSVIDQWAQLQIDALPFLNHEAPYPFYDLRLPVLRKKLDELVDEGMCLLDGSPYELKAEEISLLRSRQSHFSDVLGEIEKYPIPDSVDHGDPRPGNIRVTSNGWK